MSVKTAAVVKYKEDIRSVTEGKRDIDNKDNFVAREKDVDTEQINRKRKKTEQG